jgi:release factor glutamine methyltransferase
MTVLEVIQRSAEFLSRKGVESARLQAELLLAHLLRLKRMQLYLNFERSLSDVQVDEYRQLIRRRGEREPLQHIVGSTSFCGFEIAVDRSVLAPRPETEMLAEQGWAFLNQIASAGLPSPKALDFGTGSGCVAISLAANCPSARILATDISAEALTIARRNAAANGLAERIRFVEGDGFQAIGSGERFHLLISNPPYIPSGEISSLEPEVRDFDPSRALDGGIDGLDFYRQIAAEGLAFLEPRGKCMVEFGDGQAEQLREIFAKQNWIVESVHEDYTHRPRILIARAKDSPAGPNENF